MVEKLKTEEVRNIIGDKRFQIALTTILFLLILITSIQIRTSNLPLLKDSTTGEYIPLALDPFYFLRITETIVANNGVLPAYDSIRFYPGSETNWHNEIMPKVVVGMWKLTSAFNPDISLRYIDVISPVFFYGIGLIIFFFLALILTKSRLISILAVALLAYNPSYLYRTMAGFSDHEAIGMVTFFLALLVYLISIIYLEKSKTKLWCTMLGGALTGFATALTIAGWGGVANFLYIIIPLSFFLIWMINVKDKKESKKFSIKSLSFYISWIIFTVISGFILKQGNLIDRFLASSNIASMAILGFILIDTLLIYFPTKFIKEKYRVLYSLSLTGFLGSIALALIGKSILTILIRIYQYLISPIGSSSARLTLTVAENAQPYLVSWIANMGAQVFWLFLFGTILFGVYLSHKIKDKRHAWGFGASYVFMVFAIIFSKYSSTSMLNGDNFLSRSLYVIGLLTFWIYFFYIYFNEKLTWTSVDAMFFGIIFYVILAGRAATRVFFAITPFVCLIGAYFVVRVFKELKISKDEIMRIILFGTVIISVVAIIFAIYTSYVSIEQQAKYTGPSANVQWQKAMEFVRENTSSEAVFSHWWDYGYWVETLGERRTTNDGGHFQGEFGNHRVGRYVLTTQNPETAYSFFKTMEVTHLLIDQTELGKYSAYSKIGSDENWDRFSSIPSGTYDPSQIQETKNSQILYYNVQGMVDEDIYYVDEDGKEIFLPSPTYDSFGNPSVKSYLGAIFCEITNNSMKQPTGIYIYNNIQYRIPIRYAYVNNKLVDFKEGIDAVAYVLPSVRNNGIDPIGGMIYLSPKVQKSLYARVYLMDNAFEDYNELNLIHSEDDSVIASIKAQGASVGDFVYYQGLRGPIKIWDVTKAADKGSFVEELLQNNKEDGCYGCLDSLWD